MNVRCHSLVQLILRCRSSLCFLGIESEMIEAVACEYNPDTPGISYRREGMKRNEGEVSGGCIIC